MTIFLGCGFAAKYREGGGVFAVPLQWMLGLQRLKADAVWLEIFPGSGDPHADAAAIKSFQRQVRSYGLKYCLLYQPRADDRHELETMKAFGLSKAELRRRLAGENILLNLSYSIHPPLLLEFEHRLFCDLDPSEIFYWMTKLELGQSTHHEFWTIGLNVGAADCRLPPSKLKWRTFFPLVDTERFQVLPRASHRKFVTVGQWYWGGAVEVDGAFPDLSKRFAFEKFLGLPHRIPEARFELAMNIRVDDPEHARLRKSGWHLADPHRVTRSSRKYRRYLASADGEFTAVKGVDVAWQTGWLSDRAAAFLAAGRPVITEDTGAGRYLPPESGVHFVSNLDAAEEATRTILREWTSSSQASRATAVEHFDAEKNLRKILGLAR